MANDDFYIINSWMIDELGLSGIELQCFAIIWSFSRGKKQMYIAGNSHLIKMTKKTEPTIIKTLKSLCEKGMIKKTPTIINNVERNFYKAVTQGAKLFTENEDKNKVEGLNNLSGGTKNFLAPNKESNIESNNKEKISLSNDKQKDELFEKFWADYGRKGTKGNALKEWNKLKDKDKNQLISNTPKYIIYCKRSNRAMKDASTFIHQRCFDEDWDIIPDYYQVQETDSERLVKFKKYMVERYRDLIYHRNPLTFEEATELLEQYESEQFEWAMDRLTKRNIHQYYSIKSAINKIMQEEE